MNKKIKINNKKNNNKKMINQFLFLVDPKKQRKEDGDLKSNIILKFIHNK